MNPPKAPAVRCRYAVLVEAHTFCTTLDLQLSFYRPLCCNSRAPRPLLQSLLTTTLACSSGTALDMFWRKYRTPEWKEGREQ